jgi:hypothetical protein|tara:strand:+ start:49 stop:186 length:138 start_codon:yes stop_codon:yes gene_type:complete
MKSFVQWHKDRIACVANYFELSDYQIMWLALAKGFVLGYILGVHQ